MIDLFMAMLPNYLKKSGQPQTNQMPLSLIMIELTEKITMVLHRRPLVAIDHGDVCNGICLSVMLQRLLLTQALQVLTTKGKDI